MQKFAALAASAGELAASAGELLEKADKRAGEVTEKVKERAGLPTPSRSSREDESEGVFVPVSSAAASLLDEAERDQWVQQPGRPTAGAAPSREDAGEGAEEEGGASGQAEGEPAEAAELDEWEQQRKARRGEWVALQQELQILSMHGKKLQAGRVGVRVRVRIGLRANPNPRVRTGLRANPNPRVRVRIGRRADPNPSSNHGRHTAGAADGVRGAAGAGAPHGAAAAAAAAGGGGGAARGGGAAARGRAAREAGGRGLRLGLG